MFSAGYFNQQGVVVNSDYERFSARAKVDSELNSWLKMGINVAPTYMNANKTTQGHWASDGVINAALTTSPIVPVYNEDGTWASQAMYAVASDGLTGVPNCGLDTYPQLRHRPPSVHQRLHRTLLVEELEVEIHNRCRYP